MNKKWVCFFSQTGSEINAIRKVLKRDPDLIITNKSDLSDVNFELLTDCFDKLLILPGKPQLEEYLTALKGYNKAIITLHGYLRILPSKICDKYEIYNGHPGDVTIQDGILKGKDPQLKAFNLGLEETGSTIHKCTSELDGGEIMDIQKVSIKGLSLDEIYETLHNNSVNQWVKFLKNKI